MRLLQESRKINDSLKIQYQFMIMYVFSSIISKVKFKYAEMVDIKEKLLKNDSCLCITDAQVRKSS